MPPLPSKNAAGNPIPHRSPRRSPPRRAPAVRQASDLHRPHRHSASRRNLRRGASPHPHRLERPFSIAMRAHLVARSRYAEDNLAHAVANGVRQYVLLGAGLDTFAYRNPWPQLHVFEVDHPATQQWKRELLQTSAIPIPQNLTYAPVDFECESLPEQLLQAGFDPYAANLLRLARSRPLPHPPRLPRNRSLHRRATSRQRNHSRLRPATLRAPVPRAARPRLARRPRQTRRRTLPALLHANRHRG